MGMSFMDYFSSRVEQEVGTVNWPDKRKIKMTQIHYVAMKAANKRVDKDVSSGSLKSSGIPRLPIPIPEVHGSRGWKR